MHADLKGLGSRSAVAILAESDPDRVPELVPERYKRMTEIRSPFARRRCGYGSRPCTTADGGDLRFRQAVIVT